MPALPDWKNFIRENDPATPIDGISPFETDLDQFQIGHVIEWDFAVPSSGGGAGAGGGVGGAFGFALTNALGGGIDFGNSTGSFEFKLQEGDAIAFWMKVTLAFQWTAFSFGGLAGGGLDLFTWAFVKETIDVYVIDGAPTDKHPTTPDPENPSWRYTIGGTALSEFGIAIPGGGDGVGILGGHISSFWQGPLYQNARIPGSAALDIIKDSASGGVVVRIANWRLRAIAGLEEIDAYFNSFGLLAKAYARGGSVYLSLASLPGADNEMGLVGKGGEPSIAEDLAGIVYTHVLAPDGKTYEYSSFDSGHTSARRRIRKDATTLDEEDVIVWGTGFNMPRMVKLEDGHRGTITYKNGTLWFVTSRDNFKGRVSVAKVSQQEPYELSVSDSGVYYVSSPGRQEFYSDQGGEVWKPVPVATT